MHMHKLHNKEFSTGLVVKDCFLGNKRNIIIGDYE